MDLGNLEGLSGTEFKARPDCPGMIVRSLATKARENKSVGFFGAPSRDAGERVAFVSVI